MTRDSRREYARRMHRVVAHIDSHLGEELSLAALADVAHFSPFHFHRLFTAWMGETVGDYVRRRRLEVAATRLAAQPRTPVLDIALTVGFGSAEAFAHAFKARFGMSATTWRAERSSKRDQVLRKHDQAAAAALGHDAASTSTGTSDMDVKLVDREPVRLVCLRYVGPYGLPLARYWEATVMPWMGRRGFRGRAMYAISHDNPNVTAPDRCRCDIGVEIGAESGFVATGDEHVVDVPGGRYAVMPFFGNVDRIGPAWTSLMRDWLPDSGLQLDARPTFEYYPANMKTGPDRSFECEITIPVAPLR